MFFVLSGFLITRLLLDECGRNGSVSLGQFWWRRARRLLPALLVLLVAVSTYARIADQPDIISHLRGDVLATLAYVANWHFIMAGRSYFAATGGPSMLQHTWSLAIEEQFYLVWPLVVLAAIKVCRVFRSRPASDRTAPAGLLLGLALVGAGASAAAMALLYTPGGDPSRVYFGTDTHAQGILVGCALAALLSLVGPVRSRLGRRLLMLAGWASAAALVIVWALVSDRSALLYRGGFLTFAVACGCLIAALVQEDESSLHRLLGVSPLRHLGVVSYGIYLWHWPVFVALDGTRSGLHGYSLLLARVAVTLVLAELSYRAIERPIRRSRGAGTRQWLLAPAAIALTGILVAAETSGAPAATSGLALPVRLATATAAANAKTTAAANGKTTASASATAAATGAAIAAGPSAAATPAAAPQRVLMVGDSVALTMSMGLIAAEPPYHLDITGRAMLGCGVVRVGMVDYLGHPVTSGPCFNWPTTWASDISSVNPAVTIVLVGRWELIDRTFMGRRTHIGDPAFDAYLTQELKLAVDVLSARGGKVMLLTAPYFVGGERPDGSLPPEDQPARVDRFNVLLRQVAASSGGRAEIADTGSWLSPGGRYASTVDRVLVRWSDGIHVTIAGGMWVAQRLLPLVAQLAATPRSS